MAYREGRALPEHVTIPNWDAYQVRIVRDGHELSASFGWNLYGGKRSALRETVRWRDRMLAVLPPAGNAKGGFRRAPLANKRTWERVGVTRYVSADRRRPGQLVYLRFGVNWIDANGKRRTKSFQVGRVEDRTDAEELHAANTAEAFRAEWEFCQLSGHDFDERKYRNWRETRLYPFEVDALLCGRQPPASTLINRRVAQDVGPAHARATKPEVNGRSKASQVVLELQTGQQIVAHRERLGLSQEAYWRPLKVTQALGSRYESGDRSLSNELRVMLTLVHGGRDNAAELVSELRQEASWKRVRPDSRAVLMFESPSELRVFRKEMALTQGNFWSKAGFKQSRGSRYEGESRPIPWRVRILLTLTYGAPETAAALFAELRDRVPPTRHARTRSGWPVCPSRIPLLD